MAKCALTILLDEPERVRVAGEPVKGTLVVRAEQSVTCKRLDVASIWTTHGSGNIARGEIDSKTLFEGSWEAGQEYRYAFELNSANWPPTYYGTHLNVSQMIEARAKLPWAFDPKATVEFPVIATASPDDLAPVVKKRETSILGWVVGVIFLVLFLIPLIMLLGVLLLVVVPIGLVAGGLFWFFRVFLPSRLTGPVECEITPPRQAAGQSLSGRLRFSPRRDLRINGIQWKVTAKEQCVSGSGSNRKTHTHKVLETVHRLADAGQLPFGKPQAFDFGFPLPETSPPSLKFTDNELIWEGEMRIDIPGWPDWVKSFKLTVTPPAISPDTSLSQQVARVAAAPSNGDLSFDDVAEQILMSEDDPARRQLVIDAVLGQAFQLRADLDGPPNSLAGLDGGRGAWLQGQHRGTGLTLALLWPDGVPPPRTPAFSWQGVATVAGYDEVHGRIVMHLANGP